ncbi:hypothetical protein BJ684DRAFT_17536 [Piptocephalis cylindrospora]|uniref:RGS domain-containing protein n=1 Tax=Piptocephalis cylindrospora TaxID=1907219 RepID=A0A4P9XZV2_9FUNG|nr:hypothetical protein BJ684DRAFT_17536 [Piptocephalis cylindrospora]|eukprot:RKP11924.1 hypothetical protein BJ684DRAFT_17536 [Piptocephalis cylindrospora]
MTWSCLPEEGYDSAPLVTHGLALYLAIIIPWVALILALTGLLFRHRSHPFIFHRLPATSLLVIPSMLFLPAWMLYRPLLGGAPGCLWDIWSCALLLTPLFLLPVSRFLHVIFMLRLNRTLFSLIQPSMELGVQKDALISHITSTFQDWEVPLTPWILHDTPLSGTITPPKLSTVSLPGTMEEKPSDLSLILDDPMDQIALHESAPGLETREEPRQKPWWFRHRRSLQGGGPTLLVLVLIFSLILSFTTLSIFPHSPYPSGREYVQGQCLADWTSWPVFIPLTALKVGLYPIILLLNSQDQDAYSIRRDLTLHVLVDAPVSILLLTVWLPWMSQGARTSLFLSYAIITSLLSLLIVHLIPLLERWISERRSGHLDFIMTLQDVLNDPGLSEALVHFSTQDFTIEQVLFYQRPRRLTHSFEGMSTSIHSVYALSRVTPSSHHIKACAMELQAIYETYLLPGSPFEIPQAASFYQGIRDFLASGECHPRVLEEVQNQIEKTMLQHTYPHFYSIVMARGMGVRK